MKIDRHAFDAAHAADVFEYRCSRLGRSLGYARQASHMLNMFVGDCEAIYQAGSVVSPNSPGVAQALKLAAQAGTALFVCQPPGPPPPVELGDGPPVVFDESAPPGLASFMKWLNAFEVSLIARQPRLTDALCSMHNDVFRGSDIIGSEEGDYDYADMIRAVWRRPDSFTRDPAFGRVEADFLAQPAKARFVHTAFVPHMRALRRLEARDEAGFAEALAEALRGHKAYWSLKKHRGEFEGLVSLMLTATAALAHDRGLRFDVESDYMPASWVTGDLFRAHPA